MKVWVLIYISYLSFPDYSCTVLDQIEGISELLLYVSFILFFIQFVSFLEQLINKPGVSIIFEQVLHGSLIDVATNINIVNLSDLQVDQAQSG